MPDSVTNLGDSAFRDCSALASINIPDNLTRVGESAFDGGFSLTSIKMGNGLKTMGDYTFLQCYSLNNAAFGSSLTNIGVYAFSYCESLTTLYFSGNAPSVGLNSFEFANNPIAYYLAHTTGWDEFDAIPPELWNPQAQTGDGSFGVRSNHFGFNITGGGDLVIVVKACTNLTNPNWTALATNTLFAGTSYFSDPQWTNYASRFYGFSWPCHSR